MLSLQSIDSRGFLPGVSRALHPTAQWREDEFRRGYALSIETKHFSTQGGGKICALVSVIGTMRAMTRDVDRITHWNLVRIIPWQLSRRRKEERKERIGIGITGMHLLNEPFPPPILLPKPPLHLASDSVEYNFSFTTWLNATSHSKDECLIMAGTHVQEVFNFFSFLKRENSMLVIVMRIYATAFVCMCILLKGNICVCVSCSPLYVNILVTDICGKKICKFDWFLCFRQVTCCSRTVLSLMWQRSKGGLSSRLLPLFYSTMLWFFNWGRMNGWWIQQRRDLHKSDICVRRFSFWIGWSALWCPSDMNEVMKVFFFVWDGVITISGRCCRIFFFLEMYAREWCRLGRKHHDSHKYWCGQGRSPLQLCHMGRWCGLLLVVTSFNEYVALSSDIKWTESVLCSAFVGKKKTLGTHLLLLLLPSPTPPTDLKHGD